MAGSKTLTILTIKGKKGTGSFQTPSVTISVGQDGNVSVHKVSVVDSLTLHVTVSTENVKTGTLTQNALITVTQNTISSHSSKILSITKTK